MAWYWIILIIIGYFVVGSVLAGLSTQVSLDFDDEDLMFCMVFLWPLILPVLLMVVLCATIIEHTRL